MGGYIPRSIRIDVIERWIDAVSRDEIAAQISKGTGAVSKIVKEDGSSIVDIDLLRALSKQLRRDGVTTSHFASAVRLVNRLERLGMSVEDMDSLIELMDVHCFKTGQTIVDLIAKVEEVAKIALKSGASLYRLSEYILNQLDKKNGLESQIASLDHKLSEELKKFGATQRDLDEYRKNRHKLYEVKHLEDKLKERDQEIERTQKDSEETSNIEEAMDAGMRKYVETEIDKFNKQFGTGKPLDFEELEYLIGQIRYTPCDYPQIIQLLRDAVPSTDENDQVE